MVLCGCGSEATIEIQTDWNPAANGGVGGGVYAPMCERCYAETPEAEVGRREYSRLLADIREGRYVRTELHGHGRWVGPGERFHDDETHVRLLAEAAN